MYLILSYFLSVGTLYQSKDISLVETVVGTVLTFAAPLQVGAINYLTEGVFFL
ncbi:conserved hypothetical protein [Xenorhabdus bovienii str. puntauvense]|uniref:Uncharacterized protein n=1 Tax=Xenorhabdus bovienii str. puntauvense TaxID=1398201 RepID=A0A077NCQ7_XENBV|nr:conserved hypothetical protein [Xenorhabdus bovienii str. puntauvense]